MPIKRENLVIEHLLAVKAIIAKDKILAIIILLQYFTSKNSDLAIY
jgi:hypothetical protein